MSSLMVNLFNLGGYQFKSQYRVLFPKGFPNVDTNVNTNISYIPTLENVTLRQTESFAIPNREMGTTERYFQGLKIQLAAPSEQTDKQLTINFAIDENFEIFSKLNKLYRWSFDDTNGIIGSECDTRFPIVLEFVGFHRIGSINSSSFKKPPRYAIVFQGCRIKSLKLDDVDHGASEIQKAEATFVYLFQTEYIPKLNVPVCGDLNEKLYPAGMPTETTFGDIEYKRDTPY